MNKKEIAIQVNGGKANVESSVGLKDIVSTLENGRYLVTIEKELTAKDATYFRKRFYKGVDIVTLETANDKEVIEVQVKKDIIKDMSNEENIRIWVNLDQVREGDVFSFTWLTPLGWRELYSRFRLWAYNKCDCYV